MTSRWWRAGRAATGTLLALLGALILPAGAIAMAGGGFEAYATGGKRLLALGALALTAAVLLLIAGAVIRGVRDDGPKPGGGSAAA